MSDKDMDEAAERARPELEEHWKKRSTYSLGIGPPGAIASRLLLEMTGVKQT